MRLRGSALKLAALLFSAALFLCAPAAAQDDVSLRSAVKATYLYKLIPFVMWPSRAEEAAFRLCIVGDDPFGRLLDDVIAGQAAGESPIAVYRFAVPDAEVSLCKIIYVAGSAAEPPEAMLARFKGRPILTVTDEDRGGAQGIIHFVEREGAIRFTIDLRQAEEAGIVISSKLLHLAVSVRGAEDARLEN